MKRIIVLVCALLLSAAQAEGLSLPYGEETVLSVLALSETQRTLAESLYAPILRQEAHIDLPAGTAYGDVSAAMNALTQDYPELFHLGTEYAVGYYRDTPEQAAWVEPTYRLTAEESAAMRAELYLQAYLLADANPDLLSLHDALCARATYGGTDDLRHTAAGALLTGEAQCEGYAQGMALLCRMAGIPCGVVTGTARTSDGRIEPHAWNVALLDGETVYLDVTWDDQDAQGIVGHWYFALTEEEISTDHLFGDFVPFFAMESAD